MVIPNARWETVKRIHQVVLDHSPTDRATVLTDLCAGDEPLRREVESLLAYETSADAFLDTPAVDVAAKTLAGARQTLVGRMLAHYPCRGAPRGRRHG
jgi:hypothetical protein